MIPSMFEFCEYCDHWESDFDAIFGFIESEWITFTFHTSKWQQIIHVQGFYLPENPATYNFIFFILKLAIELFGYSRLSSSRMLIASASRIVRKTMESFPNCRSSAIVYARSPTTKCRSKIALAWNKWNRKRTWNKDSVSQSRYVRNMMSWQIIKFIVLISTHVYVNYNARVGKSKNSKKW